jgi:transketolase
MSLDPARYAPMANAIRALSMDAVQKANIGHPGMPMGMADVATVLWSEFLKFDPADRTGPTATASCSRPATARC